jgi:hypothetical protein
MKKEWKDYRKVQVPQGRSQNLEDSPLMEHLLAAMQSGKDIGDFGRLTFTMIARYFMREQTLLDLLARQPSMDEWQAQAFLAEITRHDYRPPTQEMILEWDNLQDFPICPEDGEHTHCDVYQDLEFPAEVYVAELTQ